jgi:LysR family nod box-dependent transcriptional activator
VRFKRLDLNLLVVLEALLRERSVSRAAQELNLSQPAVSSALGRLREYFHDDILVSHGKKMVPTAHALSIEPLVLKALGDIAELISVSSVFDPATTQRVFRLCAPDHLAITLLMPLLSDLEKTAPGLKIEMITFTPDAVARLENGEIDFLLAQESFTSKDHPRQLLLEEKHVIVGCRKNPVFEQPITEEVFFACGQVIVLPGYVSSFSEQDMQELSRRNRVDIICPSFLTVPWMLQDSRRLAVMYERVARIMAERLALAVAPFPRESAAVREVVQYHAARSGDDGLQWMLSRILGYATMISK